MQGSAVITPAEPRAPGFLDMAPPILVAPLVAAAIFAAATLNVTTAAIAAAGAVATVLLVGWPVTFWMLDNARTGPITRTVAGLICGAAPFAAALASGIIGLYMRSSNLAYVREALAYGASIPVYGVMPWPRFIWLLCLGLLTGVATMWASAGIRRVFNPSFR